MKIREAFTCPVELTHDMIRGKWKPIILWFLRNGPLSLSGLNVVIEGISQKMLLEQLKELIASDFVQKKVFSGYPLKVEYALKAPLGDQIIQALAIMQSIGIETMKQQGREQVLIDKKII